MHMTEDVEEPIHHEFEIGVTKEQPKTSHFPNWFQKPDKLPSPDHDWNKTLPAAHGLNVDSLTPKLLADPTFKLMKGRHVIPFDHFINNDLEYLSGGVSSRKYATSVTKTKAADYGHIKYIEELVPNTMWSPVPVDYDKHAL
ncbi:hypothetical protein Tco_0013411 [Tanacetum coccineum]